MTSDRDYDPSGRPLPLKTQVIVLRWGIMGYKTSMPAYVFLEWMQEVDNIWLDVTWKKISADQKSKKAK